MLSDHVQVTVRRTRSPSAKEGFGTMLALDAHRLWEDRYVSFASLADVQAAGAGPYDAASRLATLYFGQDSAPTALAIGRRTPSDTSYVVARLVNGATRYVMRVGGLPIAFDSAPNATAELIAAKAQSSISGGYEITAVVQGPPGTVTFVGDHEDEFVAGQTFQIGGSTGNDGVYTVASVSQAAGNTTLQLAGGQSFPSAVGDGHLSGYAIVGVSVGNRTFSVLGDFASTFYVGMRFGVTGSTGNDNHAGSGTAAAGLPYVVASLASGVGPTGPTTVITISATSGAGAIPNATVDGGLCPWADGAAGTSTVLADLQAWNIAVVTATLPGPPVVAGSFTINGADLTGLFPAGTTFRITGVTATTNNRGLWTVASSALVGGNTVVTVLATQTVVAAGATLGKITLPMIAVTPRVGGQFYTLRAGDSMQSIVPYTTTTSTDLTTIRNVSDNWWALIATTRHEAAVLALAAIVEAISDAPKVFLTASADPSILSTTVAADSPLAGTIAARLRGLGYSRSGCLWLGNDTGQDPTYQQHAFFSGYSSGEDFDDAFGEAAIFGKMLPFLPGSSTYNLQELNGIVADELTGTQRTNALAKNCNVYANVTETSAGFQSGTVAGGEWIDIMAGLDWLKWDIETRIYGLLWRESNAGRKVPYTDAGAAAIEGQIRASVELAIARNVIASDPAPIFVTPSIASMSATDRNARRLAGLQVRCTAAGAIHIVSLLVEVEV